MATRKRLRPGEREGHYSPVPDEGLADLWNHWKGAAVLVALYGAALESEGDLLEASLPVDRMAELFGLDPAKASDTRKVNNAIALLTRLKLIEQVGRAHPGRTATYRIARPWPKKHKE